MAVCNRFIPKRSRCVSPGSKPWYSSYLHYLGNCRDRLFKRSNGKASTSLAVIAYRKVRNLFVSELRAAEKRYFARLGRTLMSPDLNPQRWWRLAKRACGWSSSSQIPALSVSGALVTSPFEQANTLNEQFQDQCSTSPAAALPAYVLHPRPASPLFSFSPVSADDVLCKLQHLPGGKSSGHDGITNELLKLGGTSICNSLATLFNRSLSDGIFPEIWKEAIISPHLKSGKDATQPASYRPIALLSCLSKVLERFVYDDLIGFCLDNAILPDQQFGFLRGRSAEWQLLTLLEDWHFALDRRHHVHAVFLDAAKAFDRVDHSILLNMLHDIGVCRTPLQWFHSYLSERRIRTRVAGSLSTASPTTSGVPQGSVLGPLLFLIYFKDIPTVTEAMSALFADDTLLYRSDCEGRAKDPCCKLSADLEGLSSWADSTRVTMNAAKSAELCIGRRPSSAGVQLRGVTLPHVEEKLHLGVTLSSDLRWTSHIAATLRKVSSSVVLCKQLAYRHHLPSLVIKRFYVSFVRPKLEYCSAVWCGASPTALKRLERVQIQLARAITRVYPPSQALSKAGLPTLAWRRREHCLTLMWKIVHSLGPPRLQELLPAAASSRSTRCLRSAHALEFPLSTSARHLSSFFCVTIPTWNSLPSHVVTAPSHTVIRHRLRQHFAADKFTFGLV